MGEPAPSPQELRKFGFVLALALVIVFVGLVPWAFDRALPVWPWAIAGVLAALAAVAPRALAPVYRGWMAIGHVLGWVNARIVLGTLFFVVIAPLGFLLRILGKRPIADAPDRAASSYRIASEHKPDAKGMERPF